jgi:hypothetical protein
MENLTGIVPDSWMAWITLVVTICAAIAVVLPAPKEESNVVYRFIYRIIQWVALNLGKAKNTTDPKAASTSTQDAEKQTTSTGQQQS